MWKIPADVEFALRHKSLTGRKVLGNIAGKHSHTGQSILRTCSDHSRSRSQPLMIVNLRVLASTQRHHAETQQLQAERQRRQITICTARDETSVELANLGLEILRPQKQKNSSKLS
ncbi:hypothetical protein OPT61_g9976 [Boeremia exigua]|uniref:Uncharacterized protein n=1 Tax=Boeremia exigua TaxID=749465 RepID=A0ACC2HS45_9PLEO|nr:hypothetical protein OPT61_g9976 [Boeremia exigua]